MNFGDPTIEDAANAHLIAAAPTLFEYVNKCAMNGCKEAEYIIKGVTSGS